MVRGALAYTLAYTLATEMVSEEEDPGRRTLETRVHLCASVCPCLAKTSPDLFQFHCVEGTISLE